MSAQIGDDLPFGVVERAIGWMVRLGSGEATAADRYGFVHWRAADPAHEQAWQRLNALEDEFRQVPRHDATAARAALENRRSPHRRKALKTLGLALISGWLAWGAAQTPYWERLNADYATGVGERRAVTLADGSELKLNTDTAVDVVFDDVSRQIRLLRGEIFIKTGEDAAAASPRPLVVQTAHGELSPLGTRFLVRDAGDHTLLEVLEGAVAIAPQAGGPAQRSVAEAGESYRVLNNEAQALIASARQDRAAWLDGVLVAKQMRLEDFLGELSRHRTGWLRCDPEIADLKISGVYQLDDTDRALHALAQALPVTLESLSPLWVRVAARPDS